MSPHTALKTVSALLIVMGGLAALATFAMVMPTAWMSAANASLGLEPFPDGRLTQYLARSVSALYALVGVLVVYIGLNARRYLELIGVIGWLTALFGLAVTGVDIAVDMPASWTWGEGPPTVLVGLAFVWLARRAHPAARDADAGGA